MLKFFTLLCSALMLFLCGCAVHPDSPGEYLRVQQVSFPAVDELTLCRGFSCTLTRRIRMDDSFWENTEKVLARARSSQEERAALALAVGGFERHAGVLADFSHDMAKNKRNTLSGQLDCVAEATNTTVFLLVLQQRHLLAYHTVGPPAHRGTLIFFAHNTATIQESASGQVFAVDSWFHDNGEPAEIVPLQEWERGWTPDYTEDNSQDKITKKSRE